MMINFRFLLVTVNYKNDSLIFIIRDIIIKKVCGGAKWL